MMSEPRKIPAPQPNVENQRFFDAAAEGKLLIGQCDACGQPHYYPRALCPFCLAETRWVESARQGRDLFAVDDAARRGRAVHARLCDARRRPGGADQHRHRRP